ncbi:MAG: class D beta-lactamase [Chitinophagaceae bacterium]|nr:class D beta-lactamase [Chitinophagaceae bacterium]
MTSTTHNIKHSLLLPIFATLLLALASCKDARIHQHPEWAKYYQDAGIANAGIILRDQAHDAVHYYNLAQDTAHQLPASTFKIMLSLAGLELGVLKDDKFIIPFYGDSSSSHPEWNQDLTLRQAFEYSSEPYFKELARRIGKERLQHFLDTVQYGNKTIGDSVATCWTDNSLLISADEQLGFIRKLYFDQLPFTDRTQRIVRSLMLRSSSPDGLKYYYKTGWGHNTQQQQVLWIVGYLEHQVKVTEAPKSMNKSDERNYVYFFAQSFAIPSTETNSQAWAAKRLTVLQQVLQDYRANNSR